MSGGSTAIEQQVLNKAIEAVGKLKPSEIERRVVSALYWLRAPRRMIMESYSSDVLRTYAGYWNAFECLVDAVCTILPMEKTTKDEKQARIDQFLADRGCKKLTSADVEKLHRIVDPGFRAKASHVLRQYFPEDKAKKYIYECFEAKPDEDRLFQIRNDINHGNIDASNPEELLRVQDKQSQLWMIVFGILGRIIPIPTPADAAA
jgi:hypothetical protein